MPFKTIVFLKLKETQFKENQFKGGTLKKKITPKLKN
jgi:hypothetical protein